MAKKNILILITVVVIAVFLAACDPHRWHRRGCEDYGLTGAGHSVAVGAYYDGTADRP